MKSLRNYAGNLLSLLAGRQPVRPLLWSYYVTHRCTCACRFCSDGAGQPFAATPVVELGTADACRLLSLMAAATDTVDFTGGEPTLRDDLELLLAHARQQGMRTVLNTRPLQLHARPDLLRLTDVLVLGLDALRPEQQARISGITVAQAEQLRDSLAYALRVRAQTGTTLAVSAVALPGHLADTRELLDFCLTRRIGFHLSPALDGRQPVPGLEDDPDYRALLDAVIAAKRQGGAVLGVLPYLQGLRDRQAFACHPLLIPTVRPDGRLYYPCLETGPATVDLLAAGSYRAALAEAARRSGSYNGCAEQCRIFCHMGLSLFQRHPLAALGEARAWRSLTPAVSRA